MRLAAVDCACSNQYGGCACWKTGHIIIAILPAHGCQGARHKRGSFLAVRDREADSLSWKDSTGGEKVQEKEDYNLAGPEMAVVEFILNEQKQQPMRWGRAAPGDKQQRQLGRGGEGERSIGQNQYE